VFFHWYLGKIRAMDKVRKPNISVCIVNFSIYAIQFHIVIQRLKAEQEETDVAGQQHGKDVIVTQQQKMRCFQFMPPTATKSRLSFIVHSLYLATTNEQTEDFMCDIIVVIYRVK
jgi:hypothetical protein